MQPTSFQKVREERKRVPVVPRTFRSHLVKECFDDFRGGAKKDKVDAKALDVAPPFQLDTKKLGRVKDTNDMTDEEKKNARFKVGGQYFAANDGDNNNASGEEEKGEVHGSKPVEYNPPVSPFSSP